MTPSHAAGSRFIFLEIASYKRCSRPLCSSQTTTPYHTPHTSPRKGTNRMIGAARKPETNQPHTTNERLPHKGNPRQCHGPVASGPNSVPNTKPPIPTPHRSRTTAPPQRRHERPYWVPGKNRRPLSADIPPVSTRRRTIVYATGVLLTTPPHRHNAWQGCCRCSLERR